MAACAFVISWCESGVVGPELLPPQAAKSSNKTSKKPYTLRLYICASPLHSRQRPYSLCISDIVSYTVQSLVGSNQARGIVSDVSGVAVVAFGVNPLHRFRGAVQPQ